MKIVVTIPAYNEEKTIGTVINDVKSAMDEAKYEYQILLVDDGSKDSTAEIARKAGVVVHSHPKNYGLAEAFKTEMQKCLEMGADIIVHTDADGQYLAKEIPLLIKEMDKGADLVLGSRFKGKIESMPLIKRLGNRAFSAVVSQVTSLKITDAQTGFRAFTKEVAKKIPITSTHTYTQEQIIRAVKQKFKIVEVPVYFAKRKEGKSRLMRNPFDYAVKAGINLLRIYRDYEPLKFFGFVGGFLIILGIFLGVMVTITFLQTGVVGGLPRVILSALFIIAGLQIWSFGFLADMYRK